MTYARDNSRIARQGMPVVNTIADLRNIPVFSGNYPDSVFVKGHTSPEDNGGGIFNIVEAIDNIEFVDDNGITIVLDTDTNFIAAVRKVSGYLIPEMFGAQTFDSAGSAAAIQSAIDYAIESRTTLVLSGGRYYLEHGLLVNRQIKMVGNGRDTTYLTALASYTGDILTIQDTRNSSTDSGYGGDTFIAGMEIDMELNQSGTYFEGFCVEGVRSVAHRGICFRDRNDRAVMKDLQVFNCSQGGVHIGVQTDDSPESEAGAFLRESVFTNIETRGCGSATAADWWISSGQYNGDGTNMLYFFGCRSIYPGGIGVHIDGGLKDGVDRFKQTRQLHFKGLMIHGTAALDGYSSAIEAEELLRIEGKCGSITINGLDFAGPETHQWLITVTTNGAADGPNAVRIEYSATSMWRGGNGVRVEGGKHIHIDSFLETVEDGYTTFKLGPDVTQPVSWVPLGMKQKAIELDSSTARWFSYGARYIWDLSEETQGSIDAAQFGPRFHSGLVLNGAESGYPPKLLSAELGEFDDPNYIPTSPESVVNATRGSYLLNTYGSANTASRRVWVKATGQALSTSFWKPMQTVEGLTTANRPTDPQDNQMYLDTNLNKPIWWRENLGIWIDATGATV